MAARTGGVYFPVDASFCDTQAARQVRRRFGAEGFEAYIRLLCMLLREDGGRLSVQLEDDWADIADQLHMTPEDTQELIAVLTHYGALESDDGGWLSAPIVSDSLLARDEISEMRSKAAKARWKKYRAESGSEEESTSA